MPTLNVLWNEGNIKTFDSETSSKSGGSILYYCNEDSYLIVQILFKFAEVCIFDTSTPLPIRMLLKHLLRWKNFRSWLDTICTVSNFWNTIKVKVDQKYFQTINHLKWRMNMIDVERHLGHNMLSMNTRDISKVMIANVFMYL